MSDMQGDMINEELKRMAKAHAKWFATIMEFLYYHIFLHGASHGLKLKMEEDTK